MPLDHIEYENLVNRYFNDLSRTQFETVYCPICIAFSDYILLFQKGTQKIVRCKCGLVYSKTQPTQSVLDAFYAESNAMKLWSDFKDTPEEENRQFEKYAHAILQIKLMGVKSVLDIGCGNGVFLNTLRKELPKATNLHGVEPNVDACNIALSKGLSVSNINFLDFTKSHCLGKYDLITLWGVLEHVKDVRMALKQIRAILNPNGFVLVCVPNVDSTIVQMTWGKCFTFCPQHLWYFNTESLISILQSEGFLLVSHWSIESEAIPVMKAEYGLDPYDKIEYWEGLPWSDPQKVMARSIGILNQDKGYKIVMIARCSTLQ